MKTIFVVDDDQLMREMMSRTLSRYGFKVRTFASAGELLDRFTYEFPQLVISDVQMPGMNGLEMAATLREQGSKVPIMLMSAHISAEVVSHAEPLNIHRLISKPIKDMDGLITDIRATLGEALSDRHVPGLDDAQLRFLTGLAHDLRTPLTSVKTAIDNLLSNRELTPEEERMAEISRRNLNRVADIIERRLAALQEEFRAFGLETVDAETGRDETPEPAGSR